MNPLELSAILILLLFGLLGSGIWIGVALLGVGYAAMTLSTQAVPGAVFATTVWGASTSWTLVSLPLFIWMGEILFRTKLSDDMFRGLAPWLFRVPGRLLHVNVLGCGIFAAVSGSSVATTATIGQISLPELEKRGYPRSISVGSLAGAGTLGILIPPSIPMIVYGVTANVSIIHLFIAGIVPGLLLLLLLSGYIAAWSLLNPDRIPVETVRPSLAQMIAASRNLTGIVLLIVFVIGSMYAGFATPTEAAAIGVLGALGISYFSGMLSWKSFSESVNEAVLTSSLIGLILIAAGFLSIAMDYSGIPRVIVEKIVGMGLSQVWLIVALTVLFVVLGCFLDGISIIVLTSSIILPTVQRAGIDLVWFGIYMVFMIEMSLVTPPVGLNLYVLQSLANKSLSYVARAAFPFFLVMVLAVVIVTIFPEFVLFLPRKIMGGS